MEAVDIRMRHTTVSIRLRIVLKENSTIYLMYVVFTMKKRTSLKNDLK